MAILSFSDILRKVNIDPAKVKLIRHALTDKGFKECFDKHMVYEYTCHQKGSFSRGYAYWAVFISDHGTLGHTIYTDEDGVDHLVQSAYTDIERAQAFLGDQVLGLNKNRPFQWENGLLIRRDKKMIMACSDDVEDVVIPEGIETIGWRVFCSKLKLKSLTIPASVVWYDWAFDEKCPELRTIKLSSSLLYDPELEEKLRSCYLQADIQYI